MTHEDIGGSILSVFMEEAPSVNGCDPNGIVAIQTGSVPAALVLSRNPLDVT